MRRILFCIEAFQKLVSHDYVFVEFKGNYRSNDDFIRAWGLPEDIDNDHSDKLEDWIYPADVAAFFTDVRYYIHYSRHHMKQKADKSPKNNMAITIASYCGVMITTGALIL